MKVENNVGGVPDIKSVRLLHYFEAVILYR